MCTDILVMQQNRLQLAYCNRQHLRPNVAVWCAMLNTVNEILKLAECEKNIARKQYWLSKAEYLTNEVDAFADNLPTD